MRNGLKFDRRPECNVPRFNIVQYGKFGLLELLTNPNAPATAPGDSFTPIGEDATAVDGNFLNVFQSKYFVWWDYGLMARYVAEEFKSRMGGEHDIFEYKMRDFNAPTERRIFADSHAVDAATSSAYTSSRLSDAPGDGGRGASFAEVVDVAQRTKDDQAYSGSGAKKGVTTHESEQVRQFKTSANKNAVAEFLFGHKDGSEAAPHGRHKMVISVTHSRDWHEMVTTGCKDKWHRDKQLFENFEEYELTPQNWFRGTLFGGERKLVKKFSDDFRAYFHEHIGGIGICNNEQILLYGFLCEKPEYFRIVQFNQYGGGIAFVALHLALVDAGVANSMTRVFSG